MSKYVRKTKDVFSVEQDFGWGWETVCCSSDRKEARQDKLDYLKNTDHPTRIKRTRERI